MTEQRDIVYLDYAATTPAAPEVIETMTGLLGADGGFGNASSNHIAGRRASECVERATERRAYVLRRMFELGFIDDTEYQAAARSPAPRPQVEAIFTILPLEFRRCGSAARLRQKGTSRLIPIV